MASRCGLGVGRVMQWPALISGYGRLLRPAWRLEFTASGSYLAVVFGFHRDLAYLFAATQRALGMQSTQIASRYTLLTGATRPSRRAKLWEIP